METELKDVLGGIRTSVDGFGTKLANLDKKYTDLQTQVDAIDSRGRERNVFDGGETKGLASEVFEADAFRHFAETGHGRIAVKIADFQKKTAVTRATLGSGTSGVLMPERVSGIIPSTIRTFRVRDLLRQISTTAGEIDFVKVTGYSKASPQSEGNEKLEASITFASDSEKVKTLAHWIPVSRQALQDLAQLEEALNVHLMAGLRNEEDLQLLSGDGTGENLNGLGTLATAFDTSLLSAASGWTRIDVLARAIQQLAEADAAPEGIVLNPRDWWNIILTKDSTGRYIHGDPATMTETRLWGLPCSVTTAMTAGTFLTGAFQSGAAMYVRMDGVIEVSDSHADYFIRNKVAARCEERVALVTYKPEHFVCGSFTTSPA